MKKLQQSHLANPTVRSIFECAQPILPKGARVILFGSQARNEATPTSDWDVLVLLDQDHIDEHEHDRYTYPLWQLGWNINQMIHPMVYTFRQWEQRKGSPFYENVEAEGIQLC